MDVLTLGFNSLQLLQVFVVPLSFACGLDTRHRPKTRFNVVLLLVLLLTQVGESFSYVFRHSGSADVSATYLDGFILAGSLAVRYVFFLEHMTSRGGISVPVIPDVGLQFLVASMSWLIKKDRSLLPVRILRSLCLLFISVGQTDIPHVRPSRAEPGTFPSRFSQRAISCNLSVLRLPISILCAPRSWIPRTWLAIDWMIARCIRFAAPQNFGKLIDLVHDGLPSTRNVFIWWAPLLLQGPIQSPLRTLASVELQVSSIHLLTITAMQLVLSPAIPHHVKHHSAAKIEKATGAMDLPQIIVFHVSGLAVDLFSATAIPWRLFGMHLALLALFINVLAVYTEFKAFSIIAQCRKSLNGKEQARRDQLNESADNLETTLSFNGGDAEVERCCIRSQEYGEAYRSFKRHEQGWDAVVQGILLLGRLFCVLIAIRSVETRAATEGDLYAYSACWSGIAASFLTFSKAMRDTASAITDCEPLGRVLEHTIAPVGGSELAKDTSEIAFSNVCYSRGPNEILKDATFRIRPGLSYIVGASGSGKTTVLGLLSRELDLKEGRVLLNNKDIRSYSIKSIREQIAYVRQQCQLYHGSIRDNIRRARPDATDEDVREACNKAGLSGFVESLSEQYDTLIGSRGRQLSGGEKQRVGLAQAFLKDSPIFLLDEPMSSLDDANERYIYHSLRQLRGKIIVVVTHRLTEISEDSQILLLRNGLIEQGTYGAFFRNSIA